MTSILTRLRLVPAPAAARAVDTRPAQVTLEALFGRFGPMILRQARRILRSHEDARDVLQDVFVRLIDLDPSRWDGPEVSAFLYRITFNLCLNRLRHARRGVPLAEAFVEELAAPFADGDRARALDVARLLTEADEREALAAICVWVEGMSHPEAAEVVGCSERTIRNLLARFEHAARERLAVHREDHR